MAKKPIEPAAVRWKFPLGGSAHRLWGLHDQRLWLTWYTDERGQQNAVLPRSGAAPTTVEGAPFVRCFGDAGGTRALTWRGELLDLSGPTPRPLASIPARAGGWYDRWIDAFACGDRMAAIDAKGNAVAATLDGKVLWEHDGEGMHAGQAVHCDPSGVYFGHTFGVAKFGWAGDVLWDVAIKTVSEKQMFAVGDSVLVAATHDHKGEANRLRALDTKTGESLWVKKRDVWDLYYPGGESFFRVGDRSSDELACWDADGDRLWSVATGFGRAADARRVGDDLFIITNHETGSWVACLDVAGLGRRRRPRADRG